MSDIVAFSNFRDLGDFEWLWPHFQPHELACDDTGKLVISMTFLDWLEGVRHDFGQPMIITSGYRAPSHQWRLTGRTTGAHVDGMAVDVHVWGESAHKLLAVAMARGVYGVGVKQIRNQGKRYLHLDRWTKAPEGFRPRVWSY